MKVIMFFYQAAMINSLRFALQRTAFYVCLDQYKPFSICDGVKSITNAKRSTAESNGPINTCGLFKGEWKFTHSSLLVMCKWKC